MNPDPDQFFTNILIYCALQHDMELAFQGDGPAMDKKNDDGPARNSTFSQRVTAIVMGTDSDPFVPWNAPGGK